MDPKPLSFKTDIRPMFTDKDVDHMQGFGLDLSSYEDVVRMADSILQTVTSGSMPPSNSGESRWTTTMCDTFKRWKDGGCLP
ncbi:MAG: hypothetical protein WBW76_12385 [Candidatus Cybelea sp.]